MFPVASSHCRCVTSNTPIQNPSVSVTSCCTSSRLRPGSFVGDPIVNVPASIHRRTSFSVLYSSVQPPVGTPGNLSTGQLAADAPPPMSTTKYAASPLRAAISTDSASAVNPLPRSAAMSQTIRCVPAFTGPSAPSPERLQAGMTDPVRVSRTATSIHESASGSSPTST